MATAIKFCDLARLHKPIEQELRSALDRVLQRSSYILGEEVERFEESWAKYCGKTYAVGVGSGLDALTIMLRAFDIGMGSNDQVIVPSNSFIGTWTAVSNVGAMPVPVEPDRFALLDPDRVQAAITSNTKAILVTHLFGRLPNMERLSQIAKANKIWLLSDACQGHGWRSDHLGDAAAFSFYPTKNLGCLGDGGAIVTNEEYIATMSKHLRNYGGKNKDEHLVLGVNSRLDEIQAAVLNEKLSHLDDWNKQRHANVSLYRAIFGEACFWPSFFLSVNHIFPMFHSQRDKLREKLAAAGVQTMIHYPRAPHQQLVYNGCFPIQPLAERHSREELSLPIGPELTETEVTYAAEALRSALMALMPRMAA